MQGLAVSPDDAWSLHSVAHVYEMRAEVDKGLKLMESREKDWQVNSLTFPFPVCFSDESLLSNLVQFSSSWNILQIEISRKIIENVYGYIPGIWCAGQS